MGSVILNRWLPIVGVAVLGAVFTVGSLADGDVVFPLVFGALCAAFVWWAWPGRAGRHVDHTDVQARTDHEDVIVYWRPG